MTNPPADREPNVASLLPPRMMRGMKFFAAGLILWFVGFILIFVPGVSWWSVAALAGAGALSLGVSALVVSRGLNGPPVDVTKCEAFPTANFSDEFHRTVKEVEAQTGKPVYILDSRSGYVPEAFQMPGVGPPPFYAPPDFRKGIIVFGTPDTLTDDEAEFSIIKMLTMAVLSFEGFPEVRLRPEYEFAAMTSRDGRGWFADAGAIEKWLHQGLLDHVATKRLAAKGLTSQTVVAGLMRCLEDPKRFRLSATTSGDIIQGIDLALIRLALEDGTMPRAWASRLIEGQRKIEAQSPAALEQARRILATVKSHKYLEPTGFTDCFTAVLALWGLQDAVAFGKRDRRTGDINAVR